jgi:two-component system, sensor histidine kinase and response regulator
MEVDKPSILNVDDYAPGLYARTKVLRQAGFQVIEATTGAQTIRMVAEHKPAIVLLDVNLPDIDGFEVCRRIKTNPSTASCTVLHISSSSVETHHRVSGLNCGADGYLVEPLAPEVLIATVRACLRARRAEEALRRSNEDLERFAYTVTHELSEPLRTINVHTQILTGSLGDNLTEEQTQSVQFLMDGVGRMRAFIDDLLRYSHATHVGIDATSMDMEAVLAGVVLSLDAAIRANGAVVTNDPLPAVVVDSRMDHVFQNLLSNALKYCRPGVPPRVHISARKDGENWVFSVQDNGIGIEPQFHKSIFKLFHRLHGRSIPGSGIGLNLAHRIVEANGGVMWVESQPGVGSTFYFTVPVPREAAVAS